MVNEVNKYLLDKLLTPFNALFKLFFLTPKSYYITITSGHNSKMIVC